MSVRLLPVQSATGVVGLGGDTYKVAISALGTPDSFQWSKNGGAWSAAIAITGSSQTLEGTVSITFASTSGHSLRDVWIVSVNSMFAEQSFT